MSINLEDLLFFSPFKPITAIGLEKTSSIIKFANASLSKGRVTLKELKEVPIDSWKDIQKQSSIVSTGLDSRDLLIRSLSLPLKKDKDIDAALPFQAETLLPYPIEQALLGWNKIEQRDENTEILFFSAKKDSLQKHLEQWQSLEIEPEIVASESIALARFLTFYSSVTEPCFVIHINEGNITCALVRQGNVLAAHSLSEGISIEADQGANRTQLSITKMIYSLSKELKGNPIELGLITGEGASLKPLVESIYDQLKLHPPEAVPSDHSTEELLRFAVPIGLALNALELRPINFRQQELTFPDPWKHIKAPLICYYALILALSIIFYLFGQFYLQKQENQLKQQYVDILLEMDKSYDSFEKTFLAKNPLAREKSQGELVPISDLTRNDLIERVNFLQNELNSSPDSFPLFANIPRVSDVLAWLSTHPQAVGENQEGRIQIDHLSYQMVKRPIQGKKQEKYQVKVELEFSSPSPTAAREFHDALIAPNEFVDPKGEIKWNSNRGKYRTSFYLKDKTQYPGQ